MKRSRVIQFVVAAVLFSIGCISLLGHGAFFISTLCFALPGIVLVRRSEFSQPVPRREVFGILAGLLIFVGVLIGLEFLIPDSAGERVIRHPVFVAPVWALMLVLLFMRWRKERRIADA